MKALKIVLAIAVVAVIGFFAWKWIIGFPPPPPPPPPTNQFVERIEMEIDSLGKASPNSFCPELYQKIQYDIVEFHSEGFLGDTTTSDNDQWKEILSKDLYSVYAPKFVEQAMSVFNGHEWKTEDLGFIRSEEKELKKSTYLKESPVKVSFEKIEMILKQYDEIAEFINGCKSFKGPDELENSFDASGKIDKAQDYLKNNMGNEYVNNCDSLKEELSKVPQMLLGKHIKYLTEKIDFYASRYSSYETQAEYSNRVYSPLNNQIKGINYKVYRQDVSFVNEEQRKLTEKLEKYNDDAWIYFKNI